MLKKRIFNAIIAVFLTYISIKIFDYLGYSDKNIFFYLLLLIILFLGMSIFEKLYKKFMN